MSGLRGLSTQGAARVAARTELDRDVNALPLREVFAALRRAHPPPPATGEAADKAFFDELSGEA